MAHTNRIGELQALARELHIPGYSKYRLKNIEELREIVLEKMKGERSRSPSRSRSPLRSRSRSRSPKRLDPDLWEEARQEADKRYDKPSAYKSGFIVKYYKQHGGRFEGSKSPKRGLSRWFAEEWKNQRGDVGYSKKGDIYRPSKRVTKDTPKTWDELSKSDIRKAQKTKRKSGRVSRF